MTAPRYAELRREPPDIDVDFEHERREIVMPWVFDTYADRIELRQDVRIVGPQRRRRQLRPCDRDRRHLLRLLP